MHRCIAGQILDRLSYSTLTGHRVSMVWPDRLGGGGSGLTDWGGGGGLA